MSRHRVKPYPWCACFVLLLALKARESLGRSWRRLASLTLLVCLTFAATGCASGPVLVDHAFGFDARVDSPNVLILNYRYGTSGMPSTSGDTNIRDFGKSGQFGNINGGMPLGETLYVKWQLKDTGEVLEDTVDLKPLLPRNMHRKHIYFIVQGRQLHVYLMEEAVPRPSDWPKLGPRKFQYEKTYQIYPTRLP